MKFSKYAKDFVIDDIHIIYSLVTDSAIIMNNDNWSLIENNYNCIDQIKKQNRPLFESICAAGILVEDNANECQMLINSWDKEDEFPREIKITIIPTLQCNLRCWYCYENHDNTTQLSSNTIDAICNYIDRTAQISSVHKIIIDFFGGEPLMFYDQSVRPIINHARSVCNSNDKKLGISFTTNAVLISENICQHLKEQNASVSFQITLDGDREHHNQVRFLKGNIATYDIIKQNISIILHHGFHVTIRCNYTHKNYDSCALILEDFHSIIEKHKEKIDFSFHKVWQEHYNETIEASIEHIRENYISNGYDVNMPISLGSTGRCYADNVNDVVINYDGTIFSCTARDFTTKNSEGRLLENGTIKWNSLHRLRQKVKNGSPYCQSCHIFPICHGGCSQTKIEHLNNLDKCLYNYTDEIKNEIIRQRVTTLLTHFATKPDENPIINP